jgi:hypothetical protein
MERDATRLRRLLLDRGLSRNSIDAAWPGWWADADDRSAADRARLRKALADRLGLEPDRLLGDRVEFVWRDDARYKHLRSETADELAALTSFGMAVGGYLLDALGPARSLPPLEAASLRAALLKERPWVDLSGLLAIAWGVGIPVAHLRVFPLPAKSMQAMVVAREGRFAVLLGKDASYPAPVAFTLAHELGHIALGHLDGAIGLVDLEADDGDDPDETAADRFALALLSGSADPIVEPGAARFSGAELAKAAVTAGRKHAIEPGSLALILGHQSGRFDIAQRALEGIYDRPRPMWQAVNAVAAQQLDPARLGGDANEYLGRVLNWSAGADSASSEIT